MTEPASDELIKELEGFLNEKKTAYMLYFSDVDALIARIREQGAEIERLKSDLSRSHTREEEAWRRAYIAESKVKAWSDFVVVRDLPILAVKNIGRGLGFDEEVSIPQVTPEKLTDIIDRGTTAEAKLAEALGVIEPFANAADKAGFVSLGAFVAAKEFLEKEGVK